MSAGDRLRESKFNYYVKEASWPAEQEGMMLGHVESNVENETIEKRKTESLR
jgi:hypothetical protein